MFFLIEIWLIGLKNFFNNVGLYIKIIGNIRIIYKILFEVSDKYLCLK